MNSHLDLSPAASAVLELLERETDTSFEILRPTLESVRRSPGSPALHTIADPSVAEEATRALQTGEVRVGQLRGSRFGVLPLRRAREIIGCLVVSPSSVVGQSGGLEQVAALARAVLESDLGLNAQLDGARALTRRLHATLKFLGQLGTYQSDREVMHAVLHAATVWFDLDCRIYERAADGDFVSVVALPGVDAPGSDQRLDGNRALQLIEARRFSSAGDLDLALGGRRDEVLVLPVGIGVPSWLILLAGGLDSQAELTFTAIARVLTGELQARELARIEGWQRAREATLEASAATPWQILSTLLERLVQEAGAEGGTVTLRHAGTHQQLSVGPAAVWQRPLEGLEHVAVDVSLGSDTSVHVALARVLPSGRATGDTRIWLRALQPWLLEVAAGMARGPLTVEAEASARFEQRVRDELERARRFDLGLALMLVDPGTGPAAASHEPLDVLSEVLRPALRSSDLLGPRDGRLLVVLVHARADAAAAACERLRRRLARAAADLGTGPVLVGYASFSAACASFDGLLLSAAGTLRPLPPP